MNPLDTATAEVREAEQRRCRALVENDLAAIATLVRDDMVHIHATGAVDHKTQYMDGLANRIRFERADRHDLNVRVFGDVAVATGSLDQAIVNRTTGARTEATFTTTQVWVREGGEWAQASFHASRPV